MSKLHFTPALLSIAFLLGTPFARAQDKTVTHYPFDPACPWGRLANGKGMVVRCLTALEAAQLSAPKPNPAASAAATPSATVPAGSTLAPAAGAAPSAPAVASADVTKKTASDAKPESLSADVVSVTADEGTLDSAKKKLRVPRDKYVHCVSDNGGLTAETGEVTVRFLVRERGRAEGTEVEKRQGVSEGAARCIAAVVDRRPVGTPEGPAVGATAVIRIVRSAKP